ncbi:hypothetical protein ATK30_2653 [Amycolatopsis echigonensis]|uniref:Uncharacterized protein n=1 Tax=Amycolatopsis echigonensis TaxID=2576905 RepID=A0A2N3WD94_9PSEU|nr:hypothetical protein [Amycolatopsis niigatensis]PKV91866.1 hypothetical protein ATK30_2653 [Amycolatopsis niigatensis]
MGTVLWLVGLAVAAAVLAGIAWVFRDRAAGLDQRLRAAEQASRWRFLQQQWESEPMARLATVQQVHALTQNGGCQVRIVWTDSYHAEDVEIEHDQADAGDYLLLRGVGPLGSITREELLAHAGADAPEWAQRGR